MEDEVFVESEILGYRIASCGCDYGGVHQRWLIIESEKRRDSDLKQLEKRLTKQLKNPFGIFLSAGKSFKHQSDKTKIKFGSRMVKSSFKIFD